MRTASQPVKRAAGNAQHASGGPLAAVVEAAVPVGGDPTDRTAAWAALLAAPDQALDVAPAADRTINPDVERFGYQRAGFRGVTELDAPHLVMYTHPREVADVIDQAVEQSA